MRGIPMRARYPYACAVSLCAPGGVVRASFQVRDGGSRARCRAGSQGALNAVGCPVAIGTSTVAIGASTVVIGTSTVAIGASIGGHWRLLLAADFGASRRQARGMRDDISAIVLWLGNAGSPTSSPVARRPTRYYALAAIGHTTLLPAPSACA